MSLNGDIIISKKPLKQAELIWLIRLLLNLRLFSSFENWKVNSDTCLTLLNIKSTNTSLVNLSNTLGLIDSIELLCKLIFSRLTNKKFQ